MTGKNVGNLLDTAKVTWGWFQGGFAPTGKKNGFAVCGTEHENIGKNEVQDYVPHHDPFQYYKSTANPKHLPRPQRRRSARPTRPTTTTTSPTSS